MKTWSAIPSEIEIPTTVCPACNCELTRRLELDYDGPAGLAPEEYVDEDGWYSKDFYGDLVWQRTASAGPDRRTYCSDSCRMQGMYAALTASQQDGMQMALRASLLLMEARRALGISLDRDTGLCQTVPAPADAWLDRDADALTDLLDRGLGFYRLMYGTADNEMPTWAYAVEAEA